jgi:hypothetical protein
MKNVGTTKGNPQHTMSNTDLTQDDNASQTYESRPESHEECEKDEVRAVVASGY